jgi:hypothetical protein
MCKNLMNLDDFGVLFMDSLAQLAQDRVKTVRVSVAQVVQHHIKVNGNNDNNILYQVNSLATLDSKRSHSS